MKQIDEKSPIDLLTIDRDAYLKYIQVKSLDEPRELMYRVSVDRRVGRSTVTEELNQAIEAFAYGYAQREEIEEYLKAVVKELFIEHAKIDKTIENDLRRPNGKSIRLTTMFQKSLWEKNYEDLEKRIKAKFRDRLNAQERRADALQEELIECSKEKTELQNFKDYILNMNYWDKFKFLLKGINDEQYTK